MEKEKVKFFRLKERFEPFAAPRIRCRSSLLSVDISGGNNSGTEDCPRPASSSEGRPHFKKKQKFLEGHLYIINYMCAMPSGEKANFSILKKV